MVQQVPASPTDGLGDLAFPSKGSVRSDVWLLECQAVPGQKVQKQELLSKQEFLVLVPPVGPVAPKMGFSGLLPILVPFILLEGVQEPGLVEAFHSKYWGRGLPSGETELVWEEETESFTDKECFSPPQPEILGGREGSSLEPFFQRLSSWLDALGECKKLTPRHHYERNSSWKGLDLELMKQIEGTGQLKGFSHKKGYLP